MGSEHLLGLSHEDRNSSRTAALVSQARALVEQGWVGDFDELLAEALRRYLESHSSRRAESFIREDVTSGCTSATDRTTGNSSL
jgi:hypothetical protein